MKTIKLNEEDIRKMVSETVKQITEDTERTDSGVRQVLDACGQIIYDTEKRGRRFALPMRWMDATPERTKHESVLNNDEEYLQMREELLGNMEAYFNTAKSIIYYLYSSGYLSEYDMGNARRFLDAQFTPNW